MDGMLGAGEGLEGLDSEAAEGSRFSIWDVEEGGDSMEVN
jgi:hypothetical protein